MSRLSILLCVLALPGFTALRESRRSDMTDLKSGLDSLVTRLAAQDSFSGVVVVARKGAVVYQRAVGLADRERRVPMTIDTKLQIASTTKLFTQIAIRQLEQAGKLALSDTVGKYIPDYPNSTVRAKVTIDQLLRHRSGVGSFWNARFAATHASVRTVGDYLRLFENDSLLFEPGTSEAYSNGGYVILGAIIERVSGQSYHEYVHRHILEPAGMSETGPYDSRAILPRSAVGYTFQALGGPAIGDPRLAGGEPRPGYPRPAPASIAATQPPPPPTRDSAPGGMRLRIIGPDGRQLSPDEARAAVAERAAANVTRIPNTLFQAGMSGPAGDDFSSAGDFLKLAKALTSNRLLDSSRTAAVLGQRYAAGGDFRANGGGPGVNVEFSIYPLGDVIVVLSNYDPPAATTIAQFIRSSLSSSSPVQSAK
jgi:CubicO group peptidase (beta-lactamase class C family)